MNLSKTQDVKKTYKPDKALIFLQQTVVFFLGIALIWLYIVNQAEL